MQKNRTLPLDSAEITNRARHAYTNPMGALGNALKAALRDQLAMRRWLEFKNLFGVSEDDPRKGWTFTEWQEAAHKELTKRDFSAPVRSGRGRRTEQAAQQGKPANDRPRL